MHKPLPGNIAERAGMIKQQLAAGTHWSQLGGRKMRHTRLRVVFDLPSFYRLVCWYQGDTLYRAEAMSHERYNTLARHTHR